MILEIIILAMIAAFLGLRLYSVLGRRAEHEEEAVPTRFDQPEDKGGQLSPANVTAIPQRQREISGFPPAIEHGLRDIAAADRNFDMIGFLEGAKSAYGMILEAFWRGDREELRELCDDDVYAGFASAIDAREEAGETLQNKLIRIEDSVIHAANLDGRIASIAVRFQADIAAVTRDKDENVVAGSLDDAVEIRDIWTFERDVSSGSPAWVLSETDAG